MLMMKLEENFNWLIKTIISCMTYLLTQKLLSDLTSINSEGTATIVNFRLSSQNETSCAQHVFNLNNKVVFYFAG